MARPRGSKTNPNRTRLPFKQSEIERAIRGVRSMGLPIDRVEIYPTCGKILIGTSPAGDAVNSKTNPWDEVLSNAEDKKRPA